MNNKLTLMKGIFLYQEVISQIPINLLRHFDKLAKEFLENCIEKYEILMATKEDFSIVIIDESAQVHSASLDKC